MAENWKEILKAAMPIGQMQRDSLAIEKARKAKEELSAKKRKNIEPTQVLEIDTDPEVEKIKRPKVQDASKITNQTQKKEGYGLAGETNK